MDHSPGPWRIKENGRFAEIEDAHDTHIYLGGDEHPEDCIFCGFLKRARILTGSREDTTATVGDRHEQAQRA